VSDEGPPLWKKAVNFTGAVVGHVLAGLPVVTVEQQMARLEECEACPRLDRVKRMCLECGCPVEEKTLWADQECPLPEPRWKAFPDTTPSS
jgi:hypothetical protein